MTIAIPMHRALSAQLTGRSFQVVTRLGYTPWLARVNGTSDTKHDIKSTQQSFQSNRKCFIATRSYATSAAAKPAGRPKAHTGRTPAKRTTRTAAPKKPGPKTAAGKSNVGRKPKAKAVKTTTVKTKTKAKPKPKPKPKLAVKKAPSKTALLEQRRARDRELKEKALLGSPKQLPDNPWTIIFSEAQSRGQSFEQAGGKTKEAAQKFKNLTPEEKEHYNHLAHTNKEKNDTDLKKWLGQYKPEQIRQANLARKQLSKIHKEAHPDVKSVRKYPPLHDDRLVKQPIGPYILFNQNRHESGDFLRMTVAEASRLIGREWKSLDAAGKKKYEDEFTADHKRYLEEYKTVYGEEPKVQKVKKKTST